MLGITIQQVLPLVTQTTLIIMLGRPRYCGNTMLLWSGQVVNCGTIHFISYVMFSDQRRGKKGGGGGGGKNKVLHCQFKTDIYNSVHTFFTLCFHHIALLHDVDKQVVAIVYLNE